jgi:hypothetical protein
LKKKIFSAVIQLVVGLAAVAVVSYWWFSDAWFTQNTIADTTGVELSAAVPLNIYVTGLTDERLSQDLTFSMADLDELGFANMYDLDENIILSPASSNDGKNFWYAKKVNSDGDAILDEASQSIYGMVDEGNTAYAMEKTIYIATTTESYDDVASLDCYISQVLIEGLSSNQLYKAARISVTTVDDLDQETTVIYRYASSPSDTEGAALPVLDAHNKATTDPSVPMGNYTVSNAGALPINLICAQGGNVSVKKIIVRMWFEGENSFATRILAGGGFTFRIKFSLVDPSLGG